MANNDTSARSKPMGWLVGLGVLLITFVVLAGLLGIAIVARRRQQYRIQDPTEQRPTNSVPASGAGRPGAGRPFH